MLRTHLGSLGLASIHLPVEEKKPDKSGPTAEYGNAYDSFRAIWTDEIIDLIVVDM